MIIDFVVFVHKLYFCVLSGVEDGFDLEKDKVLQLALCINFLIKCPLN